MRIDWLKIPKYRNLKNLEVNFDEGQSTTVLLGQNGSGKSNLQEAIVEIFRELDLGKPATFAYTIKYICDENEIVVDADPDANRKLHISVNGKTITQKSFNQNKEQYLPHYVFGYYSGWSSRLEKQFETPTRKFREQILKNKDIPNRKFFFCRKDYSQLVLLAFFLTDSQKAKNLLSDYLQISLFETALFVLKKPDRSVIKKPTVESPTDPRFWNVSGSFLPFLDRLWNKAFAPIRNTEIIERDIRRRGESTDRIYLFIKNQEDLSDLRQQYETTKLFFFDLESLFLCDLIDEVRIKVKKTDGSYVTFSQLSEGEQQLLTVLGLLLFTQEDESIFLLDEPNTHLNPVWTYDYLQLLEETLHASKSQVIVATHDPLMIGSLYKNQVRVISQEDEKTLAPEPEYNPKGIGIEGLLKSDLYGHKLRSSFPRDVLADIDLQNELIALPHRTPEQEKQLDEATQRLEKLAITRTHPNPLFDLFAKAIAKEPLFQKPDLTREEIESQEKLANEILDKILRKSSK